MIVAGISISKASDFKWTGLSPFKSADENLSISAIHSLVCFFKILKFKKFRLIKVKYFKFLFIFFRLEQLLSL